MGSVMLCRFLTVMGGVDAVRVREMRMMGCFVMLSGLMMFRGFAMMLGGLGVLFFCVFMMLCAFMHKVDSLYQD